MRRRNRLPLATAGATAVAVVAAACAPPPQAPWEPPMKGDPKAILRAAGPMVAGTSDAGTETLWREQVVTIDADATTHGDVHSVERILDSGGIEEQAWMLQMETSPTERHAEVRVVWPDGHAREVGAGNANRIASELVPGCVVEVYASPSEPPMLPGYAGGVIAGGSGAHGGAQRLVLDAPAGLLHVDVHAEGWKTTRATAQGRERITLQGTSAGAARHASRANAPRIDYTTAPSWSALSGALANEFDEATRGATLDGWAAAPAPRPEDVRAVADSALAFARARVTDAARPAVAPARPDDVLRDGRGTATDLTALVIALLRKRGIAAAPAILAAIDRDEEPARALPRIDALPIVRIAPDLWCMPSDRFHSCGEMPTLDGRFAVVAGEPAPVRIVSHEAPSSLRVVREVWLADQGAGRVVQDRVATGEADRRERQRASWRAKEEVAFGPREEWARLAPDLTASSGSVLERSPADDLRVPLRSRVELTGVHQAWTGDDDATVSTNVSSIVETTLFAQPIFDRDLALATAGTMAAQSFRADVEYRIHPPDGFQPVLPGTDEESSSSLRASRSTSVGGDGVVVVRFVVESSAGTVTPSALGSEYRVLSALDRGGIRFRSTAAKLRDAGDYKGEMAALRKAIAAHPGKALYRERMANALLMAGLGEAAIAEAREATKVEPASSKPWRWLGWAYDHDAIGRDGTAGADPEDARTAFERALVVDSSDAWAQNELGSLLARPVNGRMPDPATLTEAISRLERAGGDASGTLALALFRAGRYREIRDRADDFRKTVEGRSALLAADAALGGARDARDEIARWPGLPRARKGRRSSGGEDAGWAYWLALEARDYQTAWLVISIGAERMGMSPGIAYSWRPMFDSLHRVDLPSRPSSPLDAARLAAVLTLSGAPDSELTPLFVASARDGLAERIRLSLLGALERDMSGFGRLPRATLGDLLFSRAGEIVQGDDATGAWRVVLNVANPTRNESRGVELFVVREDGEYRLLDPLIPAPRLGTIALDRLASAPDGGRRILGWIAGESRPISDDVWSAPAFSSLWPGSAGGADALRVAAAALAAGDADGAPRAIRVLEAAASAEKDPDRLLQIDRALLSARMTAKRWPDAIALARTMEAASSDAIEPWRFELLSLCRAGRFAEAKSRADAALRAHPDDAALKRLRAFALAWGGDFTGAYEAMHPIAYSPDGTAEDLNDLGWWGLFGGAPIDEALLDVRYATTRSGRRDPAILHTLAVVLARSGDPIAARQALEESLDLRRRDRPGNEDWLAIGAIADDYGLDDVAGSSWQRVHAEPDDLADGAWPLAQKFLKEKKRLR